jgi:RHS repeat-associated protein
MTNCQQFNSQSYYKGGYRYFFNGQEADNEVLGEGVLHAFEYRMHDTRIGRFWSVDPLAGKFPWNSTYAFAENSPIGFLELEGLEKIQFGNRIVNFTGMNEDQVEATLKKYKGYHHGKLSVKEIIPTDNDKEFWMVGDITNVYMRSTGTMVRKFTHNGIFEDIRRTPIQMLYHWEDCIDGGHDGANRGEITKKDWVVALGLIGTLTGIGALVETGASVEVIIGLVNSLDDALGMFTNGDGSLSQDLTPENAKWATNTIKTTLSAAKTGFDAKKFTKKEYNKLKATLETLYNSFDTYSKAKDTVKDEQKKKE